ncbi:leucine-rich repeat and IQ domain-containing protein 1 [Mus pahari]|uniref:leucine-rich repeat and IQ domain-containing protein 1 n=1 Tax=Mus pahari TaxID=10093 RepID=UPI000A305D17|nr:leucine-rich repeat and IQ domain-containing protein 1 [Mus pahari]XP_029398326.1 leucine-rich repeat and IQ domain-containing protein 1 [Mus pahari]
MEDSDDSEAKLREEIEAELDKISISSLENDEVENDSVSDTQSDSSDTDLLELPESVLHYINVIKNKSKTAEELILQDVEDTDIFSDYKKGCNYGTVSDSYMHLRTGSLPESKANSEQLMKILSVIEKEEFMRSLAPSARCVSIRETITPDTLMDEYILPDEADLSFGYVEVEERCRKSFEAWQDKQQELEERDKETLEAQSNRDKRAFQEEDEKRRCWMRQFEVEKKKLEDLQKQYQDKMNDELHKEEKIWKEKYRQHEEHIRNLHLQMEAERTRLSELQEKERARLFKLRYDAAVKIQATYRASVTYQKYHPIIKEQIEKKRKKAQELKEKEAKIRQKEEERKRRIEEEQKVEEERKKKMLEERRRREREYEEKKSILRQEREEQRSKEMVRLREHAHSPLIITCALKKGDCHSKQQAIEHMPKDKGIIAKESVDSNSKKQGDACLAQQLNKRENTHMQQFVLKESTRIKLKPNQATLIDSKMNEKSESLPKLKINENLSKNQCSEQPSDQEFNAENINRKNELENSNLKESVNKQCPGQGLESETQAEEHVEHVTKESVGQETAKLFGFNQELSAEDSNGAQGIIKENQERLTEEIEIKEMTQQDGPSYEENNSSPISMQKSLPSLTPDNPEPVERSVTLEEDQETDFKSERIEAIPEEGVPSCDAAVINADASVHTEGKADLQDSVSGNLAPSEEAGSHSATKVLVTEEVEESPNSEIKEALEQGKQTKAEGDGVLTCSVSQRTVLSSVEERRLAWVKTFKPWAEIFEQNQHKKIIKKRRLVKCPPNTMPPLDPSAILQYGPWKTLKQVCII